MTKRLIRAAFEHRLDSHMAASGVPRFHAKIKIPPGVPEYIRTSISFSRDRATELGMDPRIERGGRFHCGIFTPLDLLEDRNDDVADMVRGAFPYGIDLDAGGIRVSIETCDDSQCIVEGVHVYSPLYVNFMIWSVTNA